MWYNSRQMPRRGLTLTLLVFIALQLLGAMAFASVCADACPDEEQETSCPPVCALCTSCTHAQQAIVQSTAPAVPHDVAMQSLHAPPCGAASHLADDIFHVPLPV